MIWIKKFLLNVDGGSTLGNAMILAGGVVLAFSTGPVGLGVGLACGVLGFCDSQDWWFYYYFWEMLLHLPMFKGGKSRWKKNFF